MSSLQKREAGLVDGVTQVNETKEYEHTSLHEAAALNSEDTIRLFVESGANINATDKEGRTPLHQAARNSENTVRLLVDSGANINATDKEGRTPLHEAARGNSEYITAWLLIHKADVNATDKEGRTPLHGAARGNSEITTAWLLNYKADVNATDKEGRTPLHEAARGGSKDAVTWLLIFRADVKANDKEGRTPLHEAAQGGSEDVVTQLLRYSVDVNAIDKEGRTPLYEAARGGSKFVITQLLARGAIYKTIDKEGQTPLHDAAQAGYELKSLSAVSQAPVQFCSNIFWDGLKTYEFCEGAISDILTISKLNTDGHCYVARSVLEFLQEYYPTFAYKILYWIYGICKRFQSFQEPTESKSGSRPFLTEATDSHLVQYTIVEDMEYAEISGYLKDKEQLTWTISSTSKILATRVQSVLTWTLSVLQNRQQDDEGLFSWTLASLESGLPRLTRFEPTKTSSYCWTQLFSYVRVANIHSLNLSHPSSTEGLEIDFHLLLELAAVDHQIVTEDGIILCGFDTALFPLNPPESRRWHFVVTKGKQITLARVMKAINGFCVPGELKAEYCSGNVYVGLCSSPVVKIGTEEADVIPAGDISMSSGVNTVKHLEEVVERSSGNDVSVFSRIGFLGSSMGMSGGKRRDKKFRQVNVVAQRTQEDNFEGVLTAAQGTPCILWDQSVQRAWLIPAISTLLFASLRHIKWKNYSFKRRQADGQYEPATISFARESTDPTIRVIITLRDNQMLLVDKSYEDTLNDEISFETIVRQTWQGMSNGEDLCLSGVTGMKHEIKGSLIGYDLSEAICGTKIQLRSLPMNNCMTSWQPLVHAKLTPVIFCKEVGAIIKCNSSTPSDECCIQKCPKGALSCLFQDLRTFYGDYRWNGPYSKLRKLPIGNDYEWTLTGWSPSCNQQNILCSRNLQSISKIATERRKLQKQPSQMKERQDGSRAVLPVSSLCSTLVTFGAEFRDPADKA